MIRNLVAITTIGAFVVGCIALYAAMVPGPGPGTSPSQSAEAPAALADNTPLPEESKAAPSVACFNSQDQAVACSGQHASELIATDGPCTQDTVITYAGGAPGTDVLRSDVTAEQSSKGCTAKLPSGFSVQLKNILTTDADAAIRRCWNRPTAAEVGCDQIHTAEVVFASSTPGTNVSSCSSKADDYTNGAFSRHLDKLESVVITSGDTVECRVQARGTNQLKGTIRNLGTRALPIEAER